MRVTFDNDELERLAFDETYMSKDYSAELQKGYRRRINRMLQAVDRRDLYAIRANHLEKLKGKREHQHSIRINQQFRIVFEFKQERNEETIHVISIEDYH